MRPTLARARDRSRAMSRRARVARVGVLAGGLVGLGEGVALACPSCAAAGGGSPGWLVALLLAVPFAGFVVTTLVVRRLIARGRG